MKQRVEGTTTSLDLGITAKNLETETVVDEIDRDRGPAAPLLVAPVRSFVLAGLPGTPLQDAEPLANLRYLRARVARHCFIC